MNGSVLLVTILLISLNSVTGQGKREIDDLYQSGLEQWQQHHYDAALKNFNEVLYYEPGLAEAYFYRASCKWKVGDHEGAVVDYTLCLELDGANKEALLSRGRLHLALGRFSRAKRDFLEFRQAPETETQVIYFKSQRNGDGVVEMQTASGMASSDVFNYLGLAEYGDGNYQVAIHYFDSALLVQPSQPDYFVNRGLAYQQMEEFRRAKMDYQSALNIASEHQLAKYNLAILIEQQGDSQEANDHVDQLIEDNPGSPIGYRKRAYNSLKEKNYKLALVDIDKALKLEPNDAATWLNRGIAQAGLKNWEEAHEDYSIALRLKPDLAEAYLNRGNLFYQLAKYTEALEDYTMALFYHPEYGLAYYQRGYRFV